ncbi:hypothetical protein E0L17_05295 [Olsenella sp. SW781]|nr:hypothetical protein [Olsenella sp. SW781]
MVPQWYRADAPAARKPRRRGADGPSRRAPRRAFSPVLLAGLRRPFSPGSAGPSRRAPLTPPSAPA